MTDNIISELTNRLNELERTNRNMKTGLFALSIGAIVILAIGMAFPDQAQKQKGISCETMRADKVVIGDEDGRERLILELESGEPTLKMFNHEGRRQIFLGIDEYWDDAAYLSVSSRLENGNVDKQAVVVATTSRPDLPSSTQLLLYDGRPKQKNAASRHVMRLSSGSAEQRSYLAIDELSEKGDDGVSMKLLEAKPASSERRVLLDTNAKPALLSGVEVSGK